MIGSFGSLVFLANPNTLRTFDNFQRDTSARWAEHEIHLKRPKSEYLGPANDTVSFAMQFDIRYGIKPRNEMERLTVLCRDGTPHRLVIGGVPLGAKQWYIESVGQTWKRFDSKGNVIYGEATVTLKEYN
ncbi:phage tail protein [Paenibacillus camelliae]|uniref:phage tail protein n=1 Tax=Paenibacillus camelliae TaxID=512410 RepID=UPI00203B020C|nr:phage tail protein [Paenibacillus camelliae]MCM3632927.1 phage tail protein [Paenibacillus camelliae]